MKSDIDRAMQRTRRYWSEDGLVEIATGCIFALLGLLFFVEALAPPGSLPASFSAIGLPILLIIGIWVARRVVATVKARLTYPRTGYVAYRRSAGARRIVTGIVAGVMAGLLAGLLRSSPASLAWVPTLNGLVIGASLLYLGHTLGPARFYVLAILSALIGVAASLGSLGDTLGSAVYFSVVGVVLIASGGLTLGTYLSRTQPPAED